MAVREILTAGDPRLTVVASHVEDVSAIQPLIDDLLDTMYATEDAIGLAATQIGSDQAVVVIDISPERNEPLVLVNPVVASGDNPEKGEEGCLSVPNYRAQVSRFTQVKVVAQDRTGQAITINSDDFLAIVMQHEIDHLKGKLFIDYLSPLKRTMAMKKVKKATA
ncbi:peptide deformylase [Pseudoalteromonas ulvae UL12]|uniref:peptide deformylase n=1 Tax=Pseudoalteromonas ulvae TaxID=107327 RepID=UPI00186B8E50|nr:peptide deformylase [Pseudoalteromonas ulvae]MBE0365803.1 peptide deformylase [Pseudoalteromonas ulvae UL12]